MDNEFLTVSQFSIYLNICCHTVRKMIKSGKVRAFRASDGKRAPFRIPKSEMTRFQVMGMHEMNPGLEILDD